MATKKKTKKLVKSKDYGRKKRLASEVQAEIIYSGQNISPLPAIKDVARRDASLLSFQVFLDTYFKHRFWLPWSGDQREIIAELQLAAESGGHKPFGMPRGSGKTSLCLSLAIWVTVKGLHQFILLLAANREKSLDMLKGIKRELLENEELREDFPEVCYPIAKLQNRANRCKGQHVDGKPTNMEWSAERLVYPTVTGSICSGATMRVAGIDSGNIRGSLQGTMRPSLVIADDLQTDESAASIGQCEKLLRTINGAVLGCAGPGKSITVVLPCTVIRQGDVADTILDRDKSPLWGGRRYSAVYEFPTNRGMWDNYAIAQADEMRIGGDGSRATAFYAQHRAEMDEGAIVAWPERFGPDEISGIQSMMNLLYRDKWAFFAEYQLKPLTEDLGGGQLEPGPLAQRVNGLARGVVPQACTQITAFVDVQAEILYWVVCAWSEDFTGSVIDYGSFPDQGRNYFTVLDIQRTLGRHYPEAGSEGRIYAGLGHITEKLIERDWQREDGAPFRISKMLIDARFETDVVKKFCRLSKHYSIIMPSQGRSMTAASKPWNQYDRSKAEKIGLHWLIPLLAPGKQAFRTVSIETNYWKSFIAQRFLQMVGDKGALTLFGRAGQDHKMLADHCCSEFWVETEGHGRKLHEWKMRPSRTENHWFDCIVGCSVAANMLGCSLLGSDRGPPRKQVKYSEMYAQTRQAEAIKAKEEGRVKSVPYSELYRLAKENNS